MPYDIHGAFTRAYNWANDKIAAIKVTASRVDGEFDNFATGMNQVLLRSGVAPMTGDLKLGDNGITGLSDGAVGTPALSLASDASTGVYSPAVGEMAVAAGGVRKMLFNALGAAVNGAFGVNTTTPRTAVDIVGLTSLSSVFEDTTLFAVAIAGTVNVDASTQAAIVYTLAATANFAFNVRGDAGTSLDTLMAIGQSVTLAIEVPQSNPAFYCTAITIDTLAPLQVKWYGGGAPVAGNINGVDVYCITIIKTAAATFYARVSQSQAK